MEWIRVIWVFVFFFFALILIFTWSKMAVISGKIKAITRLVESIDEVSSGEQKTDETAPGKSEG